MAKAFSSLYENDSLNFILAIIKRYHVTHTSLVPTQLFRILHDREARGCFQNLKAILIGGSSMPEALIKHAIKLKWPIYTTYGLTEMASQVATTDRITREDQLHRAKVLKYRKLKISSEGEILVKGETLFQGYVKGQSLSRPLDQQKWFATGDLGQMNKGKTLTVTGRKDNMFISGGENIQPEEIERYLCQLTDVEEAVVVPIPNEEYGARPVAFVKLRAGSKLSQQKLYAHLEKYLPRFKIPEYVFNWPAQLKKEPYKTGRKKAAHLAQYELVSQSVLN